MEYFGYIKDISPYFMYLAQQAVKKQTPVAKARYHGGWEDALDASFMHIIHNYDPAKSVGLENYAARVVSTIYRSKFSREVKDDTVMTIASNEQAVAQEDEVNPEHILYELESDSEFLEDVNDCVQDLIPYFLEDYELFTGKSSAGRKLNYAEIMKKYAYNSKIFVTAVKKLAVHYEDAKYLDELSKSIHKRVFPSTRYLQNTDKSVKYVGEVNNIHVCELTTRTRKYLYRVGISAFVEMLLKKYYSEEDTFAKRTIFGTECFVTLSGEKVIGRDRLKEILEDEVVSLFLSKNLSYRVVSYSHGKDLIISSAKDDKAGYVITAFGTNYELTFDRLIVRKILCV